MIGQVVNKGTSSVSSLFQQIRRGFKGFDKNRWATSAEVFPEKPFKYGYDKQQKIKTKQDRQWYEAPVGAMTKKRFQTADFRAYQTELEEAAQKTLEGQKIDVEEEVVKVEKDEIFGEQGAPKRYYDRILQKELYFHHRNGKHFFEQADRKISFLNQFTPQIEKVPELAETLKTILKIATESEGSPLKRAGIDQEFIIEDDFYSENEECKKLFEEIKQKVSNMNYRLLPDLCLVLSFKLRYNKDVFGIWEKIEQNFMQSIHHYPVMELVKMRYASCALSPKSLSRDCLKAIHDIVFTELHNVPSVLDLSHLLFAFRHINSLKYYNLILDEICRRPIKTLQEAIALLFVFSHSLFPNYKRKEIREKDQDLKEKHKIVDHLADALANNAKQIQGDDFVRVLIGLNNLQLTTFKDVLTHIERYIIKNIDTLDAFQTSNALYGFSKANNNAGFGSEQLYKALQKAAEKHWSQFSNADKARTFYAFAFQDLVDPVFRKKFIQPWLNENLESNLSHSELHYVAFSLMFEQNKDAEIWKKFVKNICKNQYVVPVLNYYPIKLARYYMQSIFPKWNFDIYKLACQDAEATWDASRQIDSIMENNKEWKSIGVLLQNRLEFNSIGLDNFENLLLIDWAIMPQRVAIMIQGARQTLPNGKPTPLHRLKLQLLENHKFAVFNLIYKDFEAISPDQKIPYLKKTIEELIAKQDTYIKDVEEPQQWLSFMDRMQELTYRNIMIGEATKGGVIDPEIQEVQFDWSKLQKELKERQKQE
ncbi:hypothetical protein TTHERM_00420290 (macronuclear) [Tetrahymena thermophila SB210]|uniref:Uncharacterized protein n=1 Tax=Tetrahymena thermophila (strain SB210) TaxID=312017 RepID=I7LTP6_TETTS|nr:hypothetical protein TTHERM_00420290 [Tetrahymena thermophila SB210]EAR85621.2 hypothetical protein TTHERM_00420290 [Tetrahymena thermophila SB210]|eukprot:XP_001033284.2 hypothetical protein TTHERM_00420290 [Tetrahymena thermophila SB210]